MAPKKTNPSLFTRIIQSPPRLFRKCLIFTLLLVALLNFTIISILHPQHSHHLHTTLDSSSDWFALYNTNNGRLLQYLLTNQSSSSSSSSQLPIVGTNVSKPTRRPGIGSKHFQSTTHRHNVSTDCHRVASDAVLEEWKRGKTTICTIPYHPSKDTTTTNTNVNTTVEEYVLKSWEYEPTFVRYQNVEGYWGRDLLPLDCPRGTTLRQEHLGHITQVKPSWLNGHHHPTTTTRMTSSSSSKQQQRNNDNNESQIIEIINQTVIQVKMFEQHNPYERFHAMLNAAMVMRMLQIDNHPQFVLLLNHEGDTKKMTQNTMDMWKSFSSFTLDPIVVDTTTQPPRGKGGEEEEEPIKRFRDLIHLSSSGTSMITTTSHALRGRGKDHHCKSSLFRDIIRWMAMNYNIELLEHSGSTSSPTTTKQSISRNVTQIVWSSRRPYCCINNKTVAVRRSLRDEEKLLTILRSHLGPGYNLTSVDFGQLSTRESIQVVSQSDIMVGVHGAGLIWSAFLPIHGGLLEVFGGDRAKNNRHYHNVASECFMFCFCHV